MMASVSPVPPVVRPAAITSPLRASRMTTRAPPMLSPMNFASCASTRTVTGVFVASTAAGSNASHAANTRRDGHPLNSFRFILSP